MDFAEKFHNSDAAAAKAAAKEKMWNLSQKTYGRGYGSDRDQYYTFAILRACIFSVYSITFLKSPVLIMP